MIQHNVIAVTHLDGSIVNLIKFCVKTYNHMQYVRCKENNPASPFHVFSPASPPSLNSRGRLGASLIFPVQ